MSLEQLSYLAQIFASAGVVFSLIFVGYQIKQSTVAMERGEHNSTMQQWTTIRMTIAENRDIAELMTCGLDGSKALDVADRMRLDFMLNEFAWASFHIWDRTQRGVFTPGTFEFSCSSYLGDVLRTPGGQAWWQTKAAASGLIPPFVADVDAMLAKHAGASAQ